jgi:carbon starvation protein
MSAIALLVLGLGAMALGYRFYSKYIAERVFRLDPDFRTPAHEFEDGVDFVPTNRYVLWGHHFTSVAGAAPIVGPAIAVIWGWLPAFLWVVFGTIFFAGVHDAGAIWASARNKGKSIGALTGDVVGPRARSLFMIVIFLLLLMVNAVFAVVIAGLLIQYPGSVVPVWGALVVAFIIGQLMYRGKINLLVVSVAGVVALYGLIAIGPSFPISLPETFLGLPANTQWIILLFTYAAIASLLPVWMLLQPRDYINGLQLFIGLGVLFAAVVFANPSVVAPVFNSDIPAEHAAARTAALCDDCMRCHLGFHGLVSSGTTSKQIDKETDVRFVGYFGAVGEGSLALAAVIATTAGLATLADWQALYAAFGAGGTQAFVDGGATILAAGVGLPPEIASVLLAVMAVLFAATTMDTGVRLQRYIVQEWAVIYDMKAIGRSTPSTLLAVGCCLALAFGAGGLDGTGGLRIWPLFGTTNQLLAGLTLLVVTVMLVKRRRPMWYTITPLVFILLMTTGALFVQAGGFFRTGNWFLLLMSLIIMAAAVLVLLESVSALMRAIRENRIEPPPGISR